MTELKLGILSRAIRRKESDGMGPGSGGIEGERRCLSA